MKKVEIHSLLSMSHVKQRTLFQIIGEDIFEEKDRVETTGKNCMLEVGKGF